MGYGNKSINDWAEEVHNNSRRKGWWDDCSPTIEVSDGVHEPDRVAKLIPAKVLAQVPTKLALIHSEVSEALEDFRDGKMETVKKDDGKPVGFGTELVDVVIRVMDLAEAMGINLEQEIREKTVFNESRPHRHGGKKV